MAGSTSAHIKNLRESGSQEKENMPSSKGGNTNELSGEKNRNNNPNEVMHQTLRYKKYSKYWSILSNIAAIISVSSAIYSVVNKQRKWF